MNGANGSRYYGKYRAEVRINLDPMQKGRLILAVPEVLGLTPSSWAMPCVPLAGIQSGTYVVPTVGSGVWAEFEHGDVNKPIWSGCFWGSAAEVPVLGLAGTPASPNIAIQTPGQTTLVLSDVPAIGILLKTATGAMITINETGILLSNGKGATVLLSANAVTVNAGALVVT